VISDGVKSSFLDIAKAVLPELVLGHVLFTIYINNIGISVKTSNIHLYADNTMYTIAPIVDQATLDLQWDFVALQKALVGSKPVLNAGKTKYTLRSESIHTP
jgi:hypothetical protein